MTMHRAPTDPASGQPSVTPPDGGAVAIVFANLKGNLGDFAILHAMLVSAGAAFPGRRIHVYSHPLHDVDAARMEAFCRLAPPFDYRGKTRGEPLGRFWSTLLKLRLVPGGQTAMIRRLATQWSEGFAGFDAYEAVLFAGGEQWSGRALGAVMFASLQAIRARGTKAFAFPFSVKPSLFRLYPPAGVRQAFSQLTPPLVVRDTSSAALLAGAGVEAVPGVDSVFALHAEAKAVEPAADRNPERVLFVATGAAEELAAAVKALVDAGHAVEMLTTCAEEDGEALDSIGRRYGIPCRAPLTWQDVVAEFKTCRLVVTNRLHGVILGTLAGALLLPVTNRTKVRGFVTDAGLRHHAATLPSLDGRLVEAALADRDETLARTSDYRSRSASLPLSPLVPSALSGCGAVQP